MSNGRKCAIIKETNETKIKKCIKKTFNMWAVDFKSGASLFLLLVDIECFAFLKNQ